MHDRQIKKIGAAVQLVAKAASSIDSSEFQALQMHDGIAYSLPPDAVAMYNEQVRALLDYEDFATRFSENHLRRLLNAVLAESIRNSSSDAEGGIRKLLDECRSFQTETTVFLRLDGLRYSLQSPLFLGSVVLRNADQQFFAELDLRRDKVIAGVLANDDAKAAASARVSQAYREHFKGACVIEYVVKAEAERAIERAIQESRTVIDMLRFVGLFRYGAGEDVRIGLLGERTNHPSMTFAVSESSFLPTTLRPGANRLFDLDAQMFKTIEDLGLVDLMMALASSKHSKVDELLRRSIHWLSVGIAQDEKETSLISMIVALECFFKPASGNSITGAVVDGVAFALGADGSARRKIAQHVRAFYGKRSKLAHGGAVLVSDADKALLVQLVASVIKTILRKRSEFSNESAISAWIDELKYGVASKEASLSDAAEAGTSNAQL